MNLSSIPDKFFKMIKIEPSGCWNWQGYLTREGYGRYYDPIKKDQPFAHRHIFLKSTGAGSTELFVCHKCDNPKCVNPSHLFLGNQFDNMKDMISKGRKFETLKTHCKYGHEFTELNTYIAPNNSRKCKTCLKSRNVAFYQNKKSLTEARISRIM